MKEILVPVDTESASFAPMRTALTMAERFNGRITVMFHPRLETMPVVDAMGGGALALAETQKDRATEVSESKEALMVRLSNLGLPSDDPRVSFDDQTLQTIYGIGEAARVYDATLIPKSSECRDWRLAFETALFEGGRPVMLCPDAWKSPSGDRIAIVWNRSTETARLLGQSLDLIRSAKKVAVLDTEPWSVPGPPGALVQRYLSNEGIDTELISVDEERGGPGAAILAKAEEFGADMLLKGAYTQSRLRQMVFGGATSDLISNAKMPVLYAH